MSLKSISQSLFLDTLDPNQRTEMVIALLGKLKPSELLGIPFAEYSQKQAAAARAPFLLEYNQELEERLCIYKHTPSTTTFIITTEDGTARTLRVNGNTSNFDSTNQRGSQCLCEESCSVRFSYGNRGSAIFSFERADSAGYSSQSIQTEGLSALFTTLAADLHLPLVYSEQKEALELERVRLHEQKRVGLSRELVDAKATHDSRPCYKSRCALCATINRLQEVTETALDRLDRPREYGLPTLQTPDAKQRDRTIGRLVRLLVSRHYRETRPVIECSTFMKLTGREAGADEDVESFIRGAAVANFDLAYEHES